MTPQRRVSELGKERLRIPERSATLLPLVHDSVCELGEPFAFLRAVRAIGFHEHVPRLFLDSFDRALGRPAVAVDRVQAGSAGAHFDELIPDLEHLGDVHGGGRLVVGEWPEDAAIESVKRAA